MEAGPELDALIAEHVMGKRYAIETIGGNDMWYCLDDDQEMATRSNRKLAKPYSTTWAGAGEVWDKLVAEEKELYISQTSKHGFSVILDSFNEGPMFSGESIPHAICLAALKAKGIEV